MKKQILMSMLSAAALLALPAAQAAVVNIQATFDVNNPTWNAPYVRGYHNVFGSNKVISVGDIVDATWSFLPGQSLTFTAGSNGGSFVAANSINLNYIPYTPSIYTKINNYSFNLLGASSNITLDTPPWGYEHGVGQGMVGEATADLAANQSVTFTGFHARFTVAEMDNGSNNFYAGSFSIMPTNGVLAVAAVPEPETWAMMLGGLGLLGLARKRKNLA